ncbi:MAG: hypothetical protein KJO81_03060, partial [Gammaproteobacteria bacterium]|nr:hypothetical protein [Gammaproteobacteria bacterium]
MLRLTSFLILLFVSCSNFVIAKEKPVHEYAIDLYGATDVRTAAREWMLQRGKPDVVPALIRSLRYFPEDSSQTLHVLNELTQQDLGPRWFDWLIWMQDNPTEPIAKNDLFIQAITKRIDKNFQDFFYADLERSIRLDEIVWG